MIALLADDLDSWRSRIKNATQMLNSVFCTPISRYPWFYISALGHQGPGRTTLILGVRRV